MPKLSPGPGLSAREVAAHQLARIYDAMIEIVAEDGYRSLKIRDVVSRAEVSTRAFYEHFSSKEDCFLQTYKLISRRATRRIIAAQAEEADWRKRPRLVFEAFVGELELEPAGARLALIEAYTAGETALAEAWQGEHNFEGMFAEALARPPRGVVVPPLIVQGMVAGVATVSKNRLISGKTIDLAGSSGELVDWAMCYPDPAAEELAVLDRESVWRDTSVDPLATVASTDFSSKGDYSLILDAVASLAPVKGYRGLTIPQLRSAAGVSRRKFDAHFDDLEDCYLAALERHASNAVALAARAQAVATTWAGGVYRAISTLCDYCAEDRFLAATLLNDDFPPGPSGNRSRQRLIAAVEELLTYQSNGVKQPSPTAREASIGAVWLLFHRHLLRDWRLRRKLAATLSYIATAPALSAPAAVASIRTEQAPQVNSDAGRTASARMLPYR